VPRLLTHFLSKSGQTASSHEVCVLVGERDSKILSTISGLCVKLELPYGEK
jgi:hypothetical protein